MLVAAYHVTGNCLEGGPDFNSFDAENTRDEVMIICGGGFCERGDVVSQQRVIFEVRFARWVVGHCINSLVLRVGDVEHAGAIP